jgi:mono/diheme cytochrome c family protein
MRVALAAASLLLAAPALPEDGAALYKTKCAACHGLDGRADTTVGKTLKVKSLPDSKLGQAEIEKVIVEGKAGTKMLPIKGLTPEQVKAIAAHARSLK